MRDFYDIFILLSLYENKIDRTVFRQAFDRFCDLDDPDLDLILKSFNINIPRKCFMISEVKQLKSQIEMSL